MPGHDGPWPRGPVLKSAFLGVFTQPGPGAGWGQVRRGRPKCGQASTGLTHRGYRCAPKWQRRSTVGICRMLAVPRPQTARKTPVSADWALSLGGLRLPRVE